MVSENFKNLKSKRKELKEKGYTFLTDKDLWDYLKNTKWCNESDLTLYDIVNDIFYLDEKDLLRYLRLTNEEEIFIKNEDQILPMNEEDTIL